MKNAQKNLSIKIACFLASLLAGLLVLAACQGPKVVPGVVTPKPSGKVATPTVEDKGLQKIIDSGAPLPPQVVGRSPGSGQELALDGDIQVAFDQPMDAVKTAAAWSLVTQKGEAVAGKITWPTSHTLQFAPGKPLQSGQSYFARLSTGAASAQGTPIKDALELQFDTIGELQISQVFPADGATDVENKAVITVIFNRPVVPLVAAEEQQNLPKPLEINPSVNGKGEWVNTSVYTFRPAEVLKGGIIYTVKVKAGLQDAAGLSSLASDYQWAFTVTPPTISFLELGSGRYNPENNYQNVRLDEFFYITFHQPMDRTSTEASISLTSDKDEKVPLQFEWKMDDARVIVTPTQRLALGTSYWLRVASSGEKAALSKDGSQLKQGLDWNFITVLPPRIVAVDPANGTRQTELNPRLMIQFASPMNIESVKARVVITPPPPNPLEWWYNEYDFTIQCYCLQASTTYEVRLEPGMMDIYSNTINTATTVRFTTGPYSPEANLQMPYGPVIFRIGGPQEFYASYRMVSSVEYKLYRLNADTAMRMLTGKINQWQYNPPETELESSMMVLYEIKPPERELKSFELRGGDGTPLKAGFYFLGLETPEVTNFENRPFDDTRLLVVASANLTVKTAQTEGLFWLTGLESGQPVRGVTLTVYDENGTSIGRGVTGEDGLLALALPAPKETYSPRFVMSDDRSWFAFAASDWGSGASPEDFGVFTNYYSPAKRPTAYIYTDRPIFRPDQPVYYKGVVRIDDDLNYQLPPNSQVLVQLESYQGKVAEETLRISAYGTFSGKFMLDKDAALGYYTINIYFPNEMKQGPVGSLGFNVAEYRKPEFQVMVSAEPKDVLGGENFNVTVQADYYSGGGVSNADVNWTLTSDPFYFSPSEEFSRFNFSDYEIDRYYYDAFDGGDRQRVVAEGQGQTDSSGKLALELPADLTEAKTSRQFTLEATLTDLSGNVVSGRATVVGHRSQVYVGIRPLTYVGMEGEEQSFEIAAVDWNSQPVPGQKVNVDIIERRWHSVQEQDAQGNVRWTSSVEEIPVTSMPGLAVGENGRTTVKFTPANGGTFRIKVSARGEQGGEAYASDYLWVSSKDYVPWMQTNDRSFRLVVDRSSYGPGDTAEILIASPFQGEAYALVTVERGHVRQKEVLKLTTNSTLYKLPVTPDMAPNVYVSVMIVKGVDDTNPRPNFKVGFAQLKVATSAQALDVQVTPDRQQAGPGEKVSYTVTTRDTQGQPVNAEVSLSLSDLATLSLADPNSDPILDFFYSRRGLGVWTASGMVMDIEDYNASIKEQLARGEAAGSGGGKGDGDFGVIAVRQNFPDTPYWEAHLETGEQGEATVTVMLPDNLTTWRMDARAVTKDTRVGQTTVDILSTKPLLLRPQTPRFFVNGDQAIIGAAVHNNTDQDITAKASLDAQGLVIQDQVEKQVEVKAHQQVYVTWNTTVNLDAQRVDLVFSVEGGGYSDASLPPVGTLDHQGIPVYSYEAPETVATSGEMLAAGTVVEAINLPSGYEVTRGSLTVKVSPSLAAGMTDGLKYLEHYPYECVEQTVSRFLPNVLTTRAMKTAGLSNPELEAGLAMQVNTALQRLYNWQNPDGGWGWWQNMKSYPLTSAYVVLGMVEAKNAGYPVNEDVLTRGVDYLNGQVRSVGQLTQPYLLNQQGFILYVLARAGSPNVSATVQLYDERQDMSYYARAYLLQTLYTIDSADPRIKTLLSDLATAAVVSATGTHWEEKFVDYWNWNTDTRTTAIVLSTLSLVDTKNPLNANAVRWLMSNRTSGRWQSTQETAWSLMALTNWMDASGELKANYKYGVALNGKRLGGGEANADTLRQTYELQVDVKDLLKDQANRLAIARDEGPGNLYYTSYLNLWLPVDQIKALDRGIIVSRSYYRLDDPTTPVTVAQQGELLAARITLVAPHTLHYVVLDDPLPAGLEAVDQSLKTSEQSAQVQQFNWDELFRNGVGWWYFDHVELRDEKVVYSAQYLSPGTYVLTYLVRAGAPGTYHTIPTTAQEFYFPEVYGRGDGSLFTVMPK